LPWTNWGECSKECGGGEKFRTREKIPEQYGGEPCIGENEESQPCNTHNCPRHGGWSTWTQWTDCSTSCDNGTQTRERACNNPTPAWGGRNCSGEPKEVKDCFLRNCPVPCMWLPWSNWTDCSKSCDNGTKSRRRDFIPAQYGGEVCVGERTETQLCNTQACPGTYEELAICSRGKG